MLRHRSINSIIFLAFLTIMVSLVSGCVNTDAQAGNTENISPQKAYELIQSNKNNPDFVILDVRTPQEFSEGHIENAVNLDYYSKTFRDDLGKLDENKTYLLYCRSGNRSGKALSMMEKLGNTKAYNMLNGINGWGSAGLPISNDMEKNSEQGGIKMEKATFAAGCFWGVEAAFRQIEGVKSTAVGYTGGTTENPTYKQVCNNKTGHAEAVQVTFDPEQVTYDQLLDVFWNTHDPTTLNRQGPDFGSQYRSAIFYQNEEQKTAAVASKEKLQNSGKYRNKIVTEITPASEFYMAEDYHQQYLEKRGLASCNIK